MPGKTSQGIPVERRVKAVVDPRVLLPHQDLNKDKHSTLPLNCSRPLTTLHGSYHDDQGHVGGPQSLESFGPIGGPPVVEGGTGDVEPARCVDGQVPVDEKLVPFILQD